MTQHRQNTKQHVCTLANEPDDIVNTFVESGLFIEFRRKVKRVMMISPSHPLTRFHIKSLHDLRQEQRYHLLNYYYVIHPLSMWQFVWQVIVSINLLFIYLFWPSVSPYLPTKITVRIFTIPNLVYIMFIISNFFTGYEDKNTHLIILKPRRIRKHYLLGYFVFDLVALLPFVFRLLTIRNRIIEANASAVNKILYFLPLVKFLRYNFVWDTAEKVKLYYDLNHYLFRAIKACSHLIFFLQFVNTIFYMIVSEFSEVDRSFLKCLQCTCVTVLLVNCGYKPSNEIIDRIYPIFFIMLGFFLHILCSVFVMQLWFQFYSAETKQRFVYNSVGAFMRHKALTTKMRERILMYLEFRYQKQFYKESCINQITTPFLRREILKATSEERIDAVDFLSILPQSVKNKIETCLINEIYLPDDIIIKCGSVGKCMFFLKTGTVLVTASDGRKVCYLRDGYHFGEIALVSNIARIATISAATPIEVFKLSKKQFLRILNNYPNLLKSLTETAMRQFLAKYSESNISQSKREVAVHLLRKQMEEQEFIIIGEEL